jgi:hypothetical protein
LGKLDERDGGGVKARDARPAPRAERHIEGGPGQREPVGEHADRMPTPRT